MRPATRRTHSWSGLGVLALILALTGCEPERSRWSFAVQPDGSGCLRLMHETAGPGEMEGPAPAEEPDVAERRAKGQAAMFLASVGGVTAWTDLVVEPIEGRRTRIEATGWFRSLADVRLQGEPRFTLTSVGDSLEVTYTDPIPGGLARLFLDDREKMLETLRLPDDRFDASVHRTRGFVEMSLAGWQFDLVVRFPGQRLEEVSGFERVADDRVALHQDVSAVLEHVDADVAVIQELRQEVRTGACSAAEAYGRLPERLRDRARYVARCRVLVALPVPEFETAFEEARAEWGRSEWKPRVDRLGQPFDPEADPEVDTEVDPEVDTEVGDEAPPETH